MKFIVRGVVEGGRRLGRELGFPTANINIYSELDAPLGVYAALVSVVENAETGIEKKFGAVTNFGVKPTVSDDPATEIRTLETHILDLCLPPGEELYGRTITVELLRFIRPEKKFTSLDELRRQIAEDCLRAREILAETAAI
ncbi:MAG: riboflavin kinase [Rikenellaceae bacterium]|jgi:riboflavin kinase/FMN adenylyltransferase|nr:riboflavin kinase [Rikenellaceae bacterium]